MYKICPFPPVSRLDLCFLPEYSISYFQNLAYLIIQSLHWLSFVYALVCQTHLTGHSIQINYSGIGSQFFSCDFVSYFISSCNSFNPSQVPHIYGLACYLVVWTVLSPHYHKSVLVEIQSFSFFYEFQVYLKLTC